MQSEHCQKRCRKNAPMPGAEFTPSDNKLSSFLNVEYLREPMDMNNESASQVAGSSSASGNADPLFEYDLHFEAGTGYDSEDDVADPNDLDPAINGFSREKLPDGLYGCWLLVSVRDFKGHSSGKEVGKWGVAGNTVAEFLHQCWLLSSKFLKQEVLFRCDDNGVADPFWNAEMPQEADFVRFALFRDKSNHRYYPVDKVTVNLLQNWRKKEMYLLLHVYSLSVNNRSVFKTVEDKLLEPAARDKAGADSNKAVEVLVKKLREKHGENWKAQDIAWMMWANAIFTAEPHLQEQMTNEPPPKHLAKLFAVHEQPHLKAIRRSFAMAHNVNAGYHDEVVSIRKAFNDLETIVQTLIVKMQMMKRRIEALETRDLLGQSFISAAEETVRVEETAFSESLASRVSEQEDTLITFKMILKLIY